MTIDLRREEEILRVPHEQVDLIACHLPPLKQLDLFEPDGELRDGWNMLNLVSEVAQRGHARSILAGR